MEEKKVEQTKKPSVKALIAENEELIKELETAKAEVLSTKDSWLRCAADFENFKKRNQDTRINAYKEGKIDVIKKILVVGDTLDRALSMNLDEKTAEGIKLIARQFKETLEGEGVTEINPIGEVFDPNFHEAIMQVPKGDGEESGTVKQVFLKGYKLNDKVIRYAQVVVIGD